MTKGAFWICLAAVLIGWMIKAKLFDNPQYTPKKNPVTEALDNFNSGNELPLREMLASGVSPNSRGAYDFFDRPLNMLEWAIWRNNPNLIRFLVEFKADPKLVDLTRNGGAHSFSVLRQEDMELLVDHGLDLSLCYGPEGTPLCYVVRDMNRGRKPGQVLEYGQVKDPSNIERSYRDPIMADKALFLIKHGVDVNARMSDRSTALHEAMRYSNNLSAVEVLIKSGASLDAQDRYGQTPLMVAASRGFTESVKILVKAGASKAIRDKQGRTALESVGDIKTLLLKAGAKE